MTINRLRNQRRIAMAACSVLVESPRELLSQAIVDVVRSFPENHRRMFVQVHYGGRHLEEAARSLGNRCK